MKEMFFPNSILGLLIGAMTLWSCSTVEIKSQPDLCSDQRLPSSEKQRCLANFEENNLKTYLEKAQQAESGLTNTKFTSTTGAILKPGPVALQKNPKQIVSFFTETNSDGTKNRGGVMVQGTPTEIIFGQNQKPAYILFDQQAVRVLEFSSNFENNPTKPIEGQGYEKHPKGFGSPLGMLKGWTAGIGEHSIQELKNLFEKHTKNGVTTLEFESGVVVSGVIENFTENKAGNYRSPTIITFKDCEVKVGDRYLHQRDSGFYDMIVVTVITDTNASSDSPIFNPDL